MEYGIRDISPEVNEAIEQMFPGQTFRGHTSPRQGWLKTLVNIGALGPERMVPVLELWQCALRIAEQRRGEGELKPVESIRGKFFLETQEFDQVLLAYQQDAATFEKVVSRLANLLYYCVQAYVQNGDIQDLKAISALYCQRAGIPEIVAWRCAAAKFYDRSSREEKDPTAEERAIRHILEQFTSFHKIAPQTP